MRPFTYGSSNNFCSAGSRLWAPVSAHEILPLSLVTSADLGRVHRWESTSWPSGCFFFSHFSPPPSTPPRNLEVTFQATWVELGRFSKICKEPFLERFFSQSLIQKSTYMLRLQSVPLVTSYLTRLNCFVELRCTILPLSSCRIRLGLVK